MLIDAEKATESQNLNPVSVLFYCVFLFYDSCWGNWFRFKDVLLENFLSLPIFYWGTCFLWGTTNDDLLYLHALKAYSLPYCVIVCLMRCHLVMLSVFDVVLYTCVSLCFHCCTCYILCNCMILFVVRCSVCTCMWMHRSHGGGAHYVVGSHTDMARAQRGQLADLFLFPQLFNKLVMGRTAQLPWQPEWTLTSEVGRLSIIGSQTYANGPLVLFPPFFSLLECPSCSILNLTCVLTVPLLWRAGESK